MKKPDEVSPVDELARLHAALVHSQLHTLTLGKYLKSMGAPHELVRDLRSVYDGLDAFRVATSRKQCLMVLERGKPGPKMEVNPEVKK